MSIRGSVKSLGIVFSSTAGSRILGLLRDILITANLGISAVNSAFLYAFTVPNLFRRLLGEGALTSALIPSLVKARTEGGDQSVFRLMNGVLSYLTIILFLITLIGIGAYALTPRFFPRIERVELVSEYGMILFPYLILVCQAAAIAAFLQVFKRFALPALSPVWGNLSMILCLVWVWHTVPEQEGRAWWLCISVLVGGLFQVLLPAIQSWKMGWRPRFYLGRDQQLIGVWKLFLPGLLGASIFQVNILVGRSLALAVDPGGVAYLYLANRLMELPLGLIAVTVTIVAFPSISSAFSRGARQEAVNQYREGVKLIMGLTLPAAVGLFVLAEPMMKVLFLYGAVTEENLMRSVPVLQIFAIGLPFYSLATLTTRMFHAQQNMQTPVKVAGITFLLNLTGSLILMRPWGVLGLAWANVISVIIQTLILEGLWRRKIGKAEGKHWEKELGRLFLAAISMGGVLFTMKALFLFFECSSFWTLWFIALAGVPIGATLYLVFLFAYRAPEGKLILDILLQTAFRRLAFGKVSFLFRKNDRF